MAFVKVPKLNSVETHESKRFLHALSVYSEYYKLPCTPTQSIWLYMRLQLRASLVEVCAGQRVTPASTGSANCVCTRVTVHTGTCYAEYRQTWQEVVFQKPQNHTTLCP